MKIKQITHVLNSLSCFFLFIKSISMTLISSVDGGVSKMGVSKGRV